MFHTRSCDIADAEVWALDELDSIHLRFSHSLIPFLYYLPLFLVHPFNDK